MTFTDHQQDIIRKINALRRVAERTEFAGQREAALAAIDRLSVRYQVNVEQLRDDVSRGRTVRAGRGWRRLVAIHLAAYLGLKPYRFQPHGFLRMTPGLFCFYATDAEFELWKDTLEFHVRLISRKEDELRASADALRRQIKETKAALRKFQREKPGVLKWYVQGYIGEVLPIAGKTRKVRVTPVQSAANRAGRAAGKAVQVNSCPRALPPSHSEESGS